METRETRNSATEYLSIGNTGVKRYRKDFIGIIVFFKIVYSRLVSMFPCCMLPATQKHEKTKETWA